MDYEKCICCQGHAVTGLVSVLPTTVPKLAEAMAARQDQVFQRLHGDAAKDTWVAEKSPKWHPKCRNLYLNEKSYRLVEKKCLGKSSQASAQPEHAECSTSSMPCLF